MRKIVEQGVVTLDGPISTPQNWLGELWAGDVVEYVTKLKEQPGRDILKVGTGGSLSRTLRHRLVDEYPFWLVPVIAGNGGRLYDGIDPTYLKLLNIDRLENGVLGLTYAPR